jgi:hypothetical protein
VVLGGCPLGFNPCGTLFVKYVSTFLFGRFCLMKYLVVRGLATKVSFFNRYRWVPLTRLFQFETFDRVALWRPSRSLERERGDEWEKNLWRPSSTCFNIRHIFL